MVSVVEVDKMASAVLILGSAVKMILCNPTINVSCVVIVMIKTVIKQLQSTTVLFLHCVLCTVHTAKNNGRKYCYCRKPDGDCCHYFK